MYQTIHTTFEGCSLRARKRWKDDNGKWKQHTEVFSQTINPFNKDDLGFVKTRTVIFKELREEREKFIKNNLGYKEF